MRSELPKLPYSYDALEPFIDARTMEIHHSKHHNTYVVKLNEALDKFPELQNKTIEELLRNLNSVPEEIRTAVRNHGGGHYNHSLFWKMMNPAPAKEPTGKLLTAINQTFGSFDNFREQLTNIGLRRFGSGWAWLVINNNKLEVYSTPNQDSPLMESKVPILGVDVWEHGYYILYAWRRDEYLKNWWNVVNWPEVESNYERASQFFK